MAATAVTDGPARWILAILPPLIALMVQLALQPRWHAVWFIFFPAIFLSSWIGGLRAGVVASAFCATAALWFFVPPEHTLAKQPVQYVPPLVFFSSGVLFGLFHDRLRRANRRTASALAESQRINARLRLFAALVENSSDFIGIADPEGKLVFVNGAGRRMVGLADDHPVQNTIITEYYPPAQRSFASQVILRSMVEDGRWQGETLFRNWQTNEAIPVSDTHFMIRDPVTRRVLGMGTITRDISLVKRARDEAERARQELQRADEAMRSLYADLERAQSVAKVGSWRLDVRRNELRWSDENYRIFGVPRGTPMTYGGFLACVHPDDRAFVDREWTAALRGQPYDIEHRVVTDGTTRWVREKADLEFDEHGSLVGGIGITQDVTERRRREEQLREAQERLELALRGADLATWDWNVVTGEVIYDARWAEMRGFLLEEVRGHVDSWRSGVHPDDWPHLQRLLDDHLQGRTTEYESEHRVRTKAGGWIWTLGRGKVFARSASGEPLRMVGTELDITSRKKAEDELRLAEARASGIVSISADAIISIDGEQRITQFNEGAEKVFGYGRAEAIGAPLEILLPERFRKLHREDVARFAATGRGARRMGRPGAAIFGRRKSGEEFPADASISCLEVSGTTVLTVALRDVTEQKRTEDEKAFLAEVGSILATTLELDATLTSIGQLVTRTLADACIVYLVDETGGLRRIKAVTRDPAKGWVAQALLAMPLDRSSVREIWDELAANRPVLIERVSPEQAEAFAQSEEHLRALRVLDMKSLIMAPLFAHGKLLGAIALISSAPGRPYGAADVRLADQVAQRAALAVSKAQLYAEARSAIRTRDDVLAVVAHDLRNPLGTIILQAGLIRHPGSRGEVEARRPAEMIERAAKRMNRLIQDLLEMSRLEAGHLSLEKVRLSARQLVSESVEAQATLAEAASLELELDLSPDVPDVEADRDRLLQILENLIGNAIKFTKRGGKITVGAAPRGRDILFWVADTGLGIPAECLPHVFERFWQARTDDRRRGAGLGLPIVKGLVEAHGGRVWVESTEGRGSTFFFTMPAASELAGGETAVAA